MRLLIDGYNLMHAAGRMNRRFGPDGLRRARLRFLNELAINLGVHQASATTIVFDASSLPLNQAPESVCKGMKVIYAIDDEDADTRIERLIAQDSAPRSLTVVSSDRRIRRAAQRRRAISQSSDDFLDFLENLRSRRAPRVKTEAGGKDVERLRLDRLAPEEVDAWVLEFGEPITSLDQTPQDSTTSSDWWSDLDLEQVAQEVEREFHQHLKLIPRDPRR
ncbi:NYN domain-containing protein [Tautonia marina]|uniref:NYN domain-containing protein n=1 Tax=Tautonia marina TaxID=2653855 RepID=UPI0013755B76|nr:NYN domain-containing protein [Tautonia marina]